MLKVTITGAPPIFVCTKVFLWSFPYMDILFMLIVPKTGAPPILINYASSVPEVLDTTM